MKWFPEKLNIFLLEQEREQAKYQAISGIKTLFIKR